ncbi:LicD family protein [Lachnospiraceae bacterium 42-17]
MNFNNRDLLDNGNQMIGLEGFGGCTIRQYHLVILEILKEVDRICRKHRIVYFLMYGSLIGAVRHRGFVPWDDDVDIILTRDNFSRFQKACKEELSLEYDFVAHDEVNGSGYTFSRIRKKDTTYIVRSEISKHGRHAGFYIDVMTLDYLSKNPFYCFIQKRSLLALHRVISPGFSQGWKHLNIAESILLKVVCILLGKKRTIHLAEKILGSVKEEKAEKVISNCVAKTRMDFHIYDKIHFSKAYYVPFEDFSLPIPYMPITLLNFNYCKDYLKKGILLEYKYEDEYRAVLEGNFFYHNDIMYIPANRSRQSHLEVFFDSENACEYYDQYYFKYFNKVKNDIYAIRERRHNEKAAKYLKVMNENSMIAKISCCELRYKKFLKEFLSDETAISNMEDKDFFRISDAAVKLEVIEHKNLTEQEMLFTIWALLKCSYLIIAARLLKKTAVLYPEDITKYQEKLREVLNEQMDAYYAIFEHNFKCMEDFVANHVQEEYLLVKCIKGILAVEQDDYDKAEQVFHEMELMDKKQLWVQYYLGIIEWKKNGDRNAAKDRLLCALDTTNYMPFLQMIIDKLKEIEGQN